MANRYVFDTTLEGFINVYEPSGKFNNCCFSFKLPQGVLDQAEDDREELLKWAASKVDNPKRIATNPSKWDDEGLVKYSYEGETNRPAPVFVDTSGEPIAKETLRDVRKGTKVRMIVQQKPYTKPAMGTTLKVMGIQIVELASGNGAIDSGDMSAAEVAEMFGSVEGFKQDTPVVRQSESTTTTSDSYDF